MPTSRTHVHKPQESPASPLASRPELAAAWQAAFNRPLSPKMRRPVAALLLRFHAQEVAHGGLSAPVEAYLATLLPKRRGQGPQAVPAPMRRLKPGTRLLRAWQGKTYTVTVADPGFVYEGKTYGSLSVIAREITGTPWSGPVFFGLKKVASAKAAT
ncbi:hypothetical protein GCM10010080_24990 [Thermomonas carbonis]|nr:hypothetical protein GCM10010080_24990 [Thermomonas carbonis]